MIWKEDFRNITRDLTDPQNLMFLLYAFILKNLLLVKKPEIVKNFLKMPQAKDSLKHY